MPGNYEIEVLRKQVAILADALNEARAELKLPAIQLPKAAASRVGSLGVVASALKSRR